MHEFALADAVVKSALRAARDAGMDRIETVTVRVGELQQIKADLFEFSLTEVLPAADPTLEGVRFVVKQEPVRFGCRVCERRFGRPDLEKVGNPDEMEAIHFIPELSHAFVRCPGCGSPDFDILAGRGVTLERVEGRSDDGPASA
ncbi:MAG: hydrogenase nickel incorporation protein HypA [Actinobacteria bacterium]|nr:hydrogenase nickel incorporation protein HypA [Actinomycetota bacterium]